MVKESMIFKDLSRSTKFKSGLLLLLSVCIISLIGSRLSPYDVRQVGYLPPDRPPTLEHPLGTDSFGRDVFSELLVGTLNSLQVGFIVGFIVTLVSVALGFIAGYYGGKRLDAIISSITRIFLVIPALPVMILVSACIRVITIHMLALIISAFSWPFATLVIRSQVLSLREKEFVNLAKASGLNDLRIIFEELIPNMLPYIGANFASLVSWAILAEIGLGILGLGPMEVTLGIIFYWSLVHLALIRNLWWWWFPPILVFMLIFSSLYLIHSGLDEVANPRLKRVTGL